MVSSQPSTRVLIETRLEVEKPLVEKQGVEKEGIESGSPGHSRRPWWSGEWAAAVLWCTCSASMIITNKLLASSFDFDAPIALLLFQFISTVLLIDVANATGVMHRDPVEWKIVEIWWPLNLIFVAMVGTGFYALKTLQVPMVTLIKNLTNLLTILGDMFFFGKRYSMGVWASLGLMGVSAFIGSVTDLSFQVSGYFWQLTNCLCTAGYALYLKSVLNQINQISTSGVKMSDITKVYYNHLLGMPWLILLILILGEEKIIMDQPALKEFRFVVALVFSGFVGFAASYSSIRLLAMSTATSYVMIGSLNKIPTAILGWILFQVQTTVVNVISVLVGLCAGIVFVRAKLNDNNNKA